MTLLARASDAPRARPTALVIGEALIDHVEHPDSVRVSKPGGSPANVAVGLARLGVEVELRTALGDDADGHAVERALAASGVRVAPSSWTLGRTSTATARIGPDGAATYTFDIDWRLEDTPVPRADVVHTGSLAMFLQPGADSVHRILDAIPAGILVSIDPNVRPALLPGRDGALATLTRLAATADLLKMSDEDAAWLLPDLPPTAVLDRMLDWGAGLAVLTRGADGAMLATRNARVGIPARAARVVDTVGAGDSYTAALIAGLLELDTPRPHAEQLYRIGRYAADAAAITVEREGADPPSRTEVRPYGGPDDLLA